MQKLIILFIVYAFFIVQSLVIGNGVERIYPLYAEVTTGILLILSSLVALILFILDIGESK